MFTKRRVLIVLTALVLVIAAAANAFASTYVGNAHTKKFHSASRTMSSKA
ncbi:hypothetical protein SAMN05660742_11493 [Propionispira arboris]|uniref:Uncharacterized protein n=1 Tax=Propionispira arboris TaxID=84035 RepID=A0A1H7B026_9FIRM|nr:hypothetical protein SAMN05660742_11493 [Propionispira arboris]